MVPFDTTHERIEEIRAMVPVVTDTFTIGAPSAMDFSMTDGPPASQNENIVHGYQIPWGSSTPIMQNSMLCFFKLRSRALGFSLDDHVCGTPLRLLPIVPC
jgi:hypothetical protein